MDLILDFGNTNKKFALFSDGKLKALEQFPSASRKTVRDFFSAHPGIRHCILASVIRHPASIEKFLRSRCHLLIMDENTPVPIRNRYRTPDTLGNDRLAAAVAGHSLFPGRDVLVINLGTCITYDFVNRRKEYLGGAISPGREMRLRALHTFTGRLPLITLNRAPALTGRDTAGSILSGVINGIAGEIGQTAGQYLQDYPDMKVIVSGGDLKYFEKRLKIGIFAVPNVVIHGLYQILLYNVTKGK